MGTPRIHFAGSGDAFGIGGRFQTCIALENGETLALIDCGATSLVALKRLGLDPNRIGLVLLTHVHGDHFEGRATHGTAGLKAQRRRQRGVAAGL